MYAPSGRSGWPSPPRAVVRSFHRAPAAIADVNRKSPVKERTLCLNKPFVSIVANAFGQGTAGPRAAEFSGNADANADARWTRIPARRGIYRATVKKKKKKNHLAESCAVLAPRDEIRPLVRGKRSQGIHFDVKSASSTRCKVDDGCIVVGSWEFLLNDRVSRNVPFRYESL